MRTGLIAALAAVLVCVPLSARPSGGLRCGNAEATWNTDLAIAAKPVIDCTSLAAIVHGFALLDQRDLPNAQARSGRGKTIDYPKAARDLLLAQRQGAGAANPTCHTLREAVAKTSDSSVALHAVELVTLIDNAAGTCTKGLRQALGDNPDAIGLLEQAADLCKSRKEAHCDELLKQAK